MQKTNHMTLKELRGLKPGDSVMLRDPFEGDAKYTFIGSNSLESLKYMLKNTPGAFEELGLDENEEQTEDFSFMSMTTGASLMVSGNDKQKLQTLKGFNVLKA